MVTPGMTVESLLDQLREAKELEGMYVREHESDFHRIKVFEEQVADKDKRINALDDACIKLGEEGKRLKESLEETHLLLKDALEEAGHLRAAKPTSSDKLSKVVTSFRQLHESEVMSPDEIGKKLFELLILAK